MMLVVIFISLISTYYLTDYFERRREEKNCLTAAIEMHHTKIKERKRKGGYSVFPLFLLLSLSGVYLSPGGKRRDDFLNLLYSLKEKENIDTTTEKNKNI